MLRSSLQLFLVSLLLIRSACQQQPPESIHFNGATMGTTWSVTLHSLPDGIAVATLKTLLQQRLDRVNRLMSTYDPESEISRFNASSSGDWFAISDETLAVVALSLQISELTGGAFDISVGPLVEVWGFGASERGERLPAAEQIEAILASVGYQKLELRHDPAAIRKLQPQLRIDLSAVAKGYAVDLLAELLKQQGIDNFLVEVGGELQLAGQRSDATPWRIAIEQPIEGAREVAKIFPLSETALATSGNYRNFYVEDGQRYSHTIDPVSGQPTRHKLASVTVLDPSCGRADALATALMVMGEERGRKFVENHRITAFFLIHAQEATVEYKSPAFETFEKRVKK